MLTLEIYNFVSSVRLRVIFHFLLVATWFLLIFSWIQLSQPPKGIAKEQRIEFADKQESLKTILFWNMYYRTRHFGWGFGQEPFLRTGCQESRCFFTDDKQFLTNVDQFDAIIFNEHDKNLDQQTIPQKRRPNQLYVFVANEAPMHRTGKLGNFSRLDGIFNYSIAYRMDADAWRPYGGLVKLMEPPQGPELKKYIEEFGKKNTHLAVKDENDFSAAWFVSHCHTSSKREIIAKQMQETFHKMKIHITGKCGKMDCSRYYPSSGWPSWIAKMLVHVNSFMGKFSQTTCKEMAGKRHKFYLSFENSVCLDYATEKFYETFKYGMIPIVYGGAQYDKIAPPHSYIDVMDFGNVTSLVDYLQFLHMNDDKFAEYFWWREFYSPFSFKRNQEICDLCHRLHESNPLPKVYTDMKDWLVTQANCKYYNGNVMKQIGE